jgi:translocation and assembly module TamB
VYFDRQRQGDIKNQKVKLDLQGPMVQLALALDGTLDKDNWRGRLVSGDVKAGGQDWKLQGSGASGALADGRLNLGAHCWVSGPASLCSEEQRLMPDPKLRLHLKQFPLDSLAAVAAQGLPVARQLNADLSLDLPASGP